MKAKQAIENFKKALEHSNAGFVYALIGALAEANSIYYLNTNWSIFITPFKQLYGIALAIFFSGALIFFILRSNKAVKYEEKDRAMKIANGFAWFGAVINLMYVFDTIYLAPSLANQPVFWNKLIYAIPFAIALPVIVKLYAKEIKPDVEVTEKDLKKIDELVSFKEKLESDFKIKIRNVDYNAQVLK